MKKIKHIVTLALLCITILFYIFAYTNIDSTKIIIKSIETEAINYEEIKEESKVDSKPQIVVEESPDVISKEEQSKESQTNELIKPKEEIPVQSNPIVPEIIDDNIDKIKNDQSRLGTFGRLYLPSVNHNVALFEASLYDDSLNAQVIVNNKDSAAYFALGDHFVIADHNYQGFKKIINLNIGDKAYVKNNDGSITIYTLKNKFVGENIKSDLISKDGTSVQDMETDLIMYTCYNTGNDIMITLWNLESN